MEAAKKADLEFGILPRATQHTVRDAAADIHKVSLHLLENHVTTPARTGPAFRDPIEDGFSGS